MLNFISTRVSELVSVLPSLPWSQFKIRFRFRIPDSGISIRPLTLTLGRIDCVTAKGMFVCEARGWEYCFMLVRFPFLSVLPF